MIFTGTEQIFGDAISYKFVFEEKRTFGFSEGRPHSLKKPSQKVKTTLKMTFPPTLGKTVNSCEYLGLSATFRRHEVLVTNSPEKVKQWDAPDTN